MDDERRALRPSKEETAHLLRSPENARRLVEALAEVHEGRASTVALEALQARLQSAAGDG